MTSCSSVATWALGSFRSPQLAREKTRRRRKGAEKCILAGYPPLPAAISSERKRDKLIYKFMTRVREVLGEFSEKKILFTQGFSLSLLF